MRNLDARSSRFRAAQRSVIVNVHNITRRSRQGCVVSIEASAFGVPVVSRHPPARSTRKSNKKFSDSGAIAGLHCYADP